MPATDHVKTQFPEIRPPELPYPVYDGGLRFLEQTRRVGVWPHFPRESLVVDVGCGPTPYPYATVLVDKFIAANNHRFGLPIPRDGRPIVVADLDRGLPFEDKSVHFLYCSHVLEHCADPAVACREIIRVARSGFIETPTIVFELILGSQSSPHSYVTQLVGAPAVLRFRRLSREERNAIAWREADGDVPRKLFMDPTAPDRFHRNGYWRHQDLFTVAFLWDGAFAFEVVD